MKNVKLDDESIKDYLRDNIIPGFLPLLNQQIYSVIFNHHHEFVICTNLSAASIGFDSWQNAQGLSIKEHTNEEKIRKVFGALYTPEFARLIHCYAEDVCKLQNQVFKSGKMISFMDLLPYGGKFSSFLINYIPIFHPCGEVIAIQSFAIASRLFSNQEFLLQIMEDDEINCGENRINLTQREQEIIFLVANGITQEQIAQILNLHRSTIANIISKQLCVKFGLAGSRTKDLAKIAIQYEFHQKIPRSLYRPFIVVLNQDLT